MKPSLVAQYAYTAGFRGNGLLIIVAICGAESGFGEGADSDNGIATGLAQINYLVHTQYDRTKLTYDPLYNLKAAYTLSNGGHNFGAWDTYDSPPATPNPAAGRYRDFLRQARQAVSNVNLNTTSGTQPGGQGPGTFMGTLPPDTDPPLELKIGDKNAKDLGFAFVGGDLQFTNTEASQLTLNFHDPDRQIMRVYAITSGPSGTPIELHGTRWRIQQAGTIPGEAGPQTQFICQPSGVMRMRGLTPSRARDLSPTAYMGVIAKSAGLEFLGEPLTTKPSIGPQMTRDPVSGQKRLENAWEMGQRLASNHDLVAYESGGTYFFATPSYIAQYARTWWLFPGEIAVQYDRLTPEQKAQARVSIVEAVTWPQLTDLALGPAQKHPQRNLSVQVRRGQGKQLRAGDNLVVVGYPGLDIGPPMILTSVQWNLGASIDPVTVQAADRTMWASKALDHPSDVATSVGIDRNGGIAKRGTASSLDFTTFALNQAGDRYQYGATPSATDKDPDAEDCSSLVQWAAAQTGLALPRTSQEQQAFCQAHGTMISVEKALNTRGALLFVGSPAHHVAVSLGNGHQDMAAHTSHAPLNRQVAVWETTASEWTDAALIPGMNYGNKQVTSTGRTVPVPG